jgi:hypothetical protein
MERAMRTNLAVVTLVVLAGCSKPAPMQAAADIQAPAAAAAADVAAAADAAGKAPQANPAAKAADVGASPMLAYSYDYGLVAPPAQIRGLLARHEQACIKAGPPTCEVTGSSLESGKDDEVHATLSLRAVPGWLSGFRDGLGQDAESVGGRLAHAATTSDDLSRQIVDTEAAIRAKTALRDRLQQLLETHEGKVADLLEVEKNLADVQDELDATQSELAVMRQRVATSELKIDYASASSFAPGGLWAPLGTATQDFLRNVVTATAIVVELVSWLLPVAAIAGAAVWTARYLHKRRRKAPSR